MKRQEKLGMKEMSDTRETSDTKEMPDMRKASDTKKMPDTKEPQAGMDSSAFTYEEKEDGSGRDLLGEAGAQYAYRYHRQGEYTLEDYYALPDEQRVELIDGVLYDMAAPSSPHQIASAELFMQLASYIKSQKGSCRALYAPLDVQLDCDDRTMLQPDVLVVCDKDKIRKRCVYGAPDFVIEILSDSTARKDMSVKLGKYLNAGVREYWIVDLQQEKVIVHDRTKDDCDGCHTSLYGMDQPVPVQIFDGKCQIYFDEICEAVRPILRQI
ncbi:MAG: Uma2 family endonuclease [Lachnospiraceae bacterium]|nr:Uma2 family endonuclease [Lachnospiraceae bacterium]